MGSGWSLLPERSWDSLTETVRSPRMIEKASFRNFKSLRDITVEFEQLTVIVGPNASGKTSILEGLSLLGLSMTARGPKEVFQGRRSAQLLCSRGADFQHMELECQGH